MNPFFARQTFLKSLRGETVTGDVKKKNEHKTEAIVHDTRASEEKKKDGKLDNKKKKRKRVPSDYISFSVQ